MCGYVQLQTHQSIVMLVSNGNEKKNRIVLLGYHFGIALKANVKDYGFFFAGIFNLRLRDVNQFSFLVAVKDEL